MNKTDVIFRKWKNGNVLALFPHEVNTYGGHVTSYEHVGQHGNADYVGCIIKTKPANTDEYAPLKKELEGIGYKLNVVKKQNYDKFLNSWNLLNK